MRIAILGAGLMGKEVARDLILCAAVKAVGLGDVDFERVKQVSDELKSEKLTGYLVNAHKEKELAAFMKKYDVVVNALFYSFNERVAKTAIEVGVHSVDLGGHIGEMTNRVLMYHEKAKQAGVTIIPDLGVAPGMINILAGYGASHLDQVESIKMYVGGIPLKPEPPLEYNHVFSLEGVFDHYTDPSLIIRNGLLQQVPSLSEIETIYFDQFGPLEAFHTSGGTSTLPQTFPHLQQLEYKTIRYPGHAKKFQLLVDLNLTKKDYHVTLNGQQVKPRDLFLKVLDPILSLNGKGDAVLLRVIVKGRKGDNAASYNYEMITFKDKRKNVTAMARATANTISVVAQMIGSGLITKRGVYPPEQIVSGEIYMKEMAKRHLHITQTAEQ